jgi:hypothetical protein
MHLLSVHALCTKSAIVPDFQGKLTAFLRISLSFVVEVFVIWI